MGLLRALTWTTLHSKAEKAFPRPPFAASLIQILWESYKLLNNGLV